MPYVRQRSILQRAPRFHLRRGLGQANPCDPNFTGPLTLDQQLACLPVATVPTLTTPGSLLTPAQQAAAALMLAGLPPTSTAPVSSFSQFLTQYQTPLLIGGGLFAGLLLLKALR